MNFDGDFLQVKEALFFPKPVKGDIPAWIGGSGRSAVRRTIMLGDGWHPVGPEVEEFRRGAEEIRRSTKAILSMRISADGRKRRTPYVRPNNEKRLPCREYG